jgi:ADP-ribose pyrophosphatase
MSERDERFEAEGDPEPASMAWQRGLGLPHEVTTGTRRGFDGHLLHVRVDDVRLPSGRMSQREIVEHPGSVVIVPVTSDREVLFVRQWRHVTNRYLLELPAGVIDPGEYFMQTAARELIEETGYEAGDLRHLTTVFMSPGYTTERTAFVLATGCRAVEHQADVDEPIELIRRPLSSIADLLTTGNTAAEDAQTVLGLLWLLRLVSTGDL